MSEPKTNEQMEKIVSLCKRRGFIYQSSEIYGGLNGFWDYGPLGAELKRNVKDAWWRRIVHERDDVAGLEATIIMHPQIWKASGHVDTFADMMVECPITKKRFRADQVEPQSGIVYRYTGAKTGLFNKLQKLAQEYVQEFEKTGLEPAEIGKILAEGTALIDQKENARNLAEKLAESTLPGAKEIAKQIRSSPGVKYNSHTSFAVLVSKGKPPESAQKIARQFYEMEGVIEVELIGETREEIADTSLFNPENGAQLSAPRPFNLMFKTYVGPVENADNVAYLRPETAQAIFAQFKNVLATSNQKVPFGIGQVGKAFRNEVTPRNFTFRSREFEQMELEFFIKPDEAIEALTGSVAKVADEAWKGEPQPNWGWEVWHKYWVEQRIRFYENIGLGRGVFEEYWQKPEELAHYARACVDILYKFPFGTQELEGIAARSDFDLSQHERFSGKPMGVFDEELRTAWKALAPEKQAALTQSYYQARLKYLTKMGVPAEKAEKKAKEDSEGLAKGQYVPHVIEPSAGVDRLILALICNAYSEATTTDDKGKTTTEYVMRFHPRIAPIKVGVFPLLKNKPELVKKAQEVRDLLRPHMTVFYDEGGSIGKRYAKQDEAGTPFGVTIDFDTLGEKPELLNTVTLRDRDTSQQTRVRIDELLSILLPRVR